MASRKVQIGNPLTVIRGRVDHLESMFRSGAQLPLSQVEEELNKINQSISISYRIVRAHHGEISCASEPNQGATFVLQFPLAQGPIDLSIPRPEY